MNQRRISPPIAWPRINQLGEQILSTNKLLEQRDLILAAAAAILDAEASLWLDERLFRLPDLNRTEIFPLQPPDEIMSQALESGECCFEQEGGFPALAIPL